MSDLELVMLQTDFTMLLTMADPEDGKPWHQLTQWFLDHGVTFRTRPFPMRNENAGRWEDAWILTFPSLDVRLLFKLTWQP